MSNSGGIGIKNRTFRPRGPSSAAALIRLLDGGKLRTLCRITKNPVLYLIATGSKPMEVQCWLHFSNN